MLADGFDSAQLWIYLIFAALAVLGGIFGKKKKPEMPSGKPGMRRGPGARPQTPATPRPPRMPRPPQPPRAPERMTRVEPITRRRAEPVELPCGRPQPVRLPAARPPRPIARPIEPELVEVRLDELEAQEVMPIAEAIRTAPLAAEGRKPSRAARGAGAPLHAVDRMLRSNSGLRGAFILSEILAPPVALRENHPH